MTPKKIPLRIGRLSQPGKAGFSLLEVIVALGIVVVAVLPMIALLPAGLTNFRVSQEMYLSCQAQQQILTELQQTDLSTLFSGGQTTYTEIDYYDDEGILVKKTSPNGTTLYGNSNPIFQATVTVSTVKGSTASPITLPQANSNNVAAIATTLQNSVLVTMQFGRVNTPVTTASTNGTSTFFTGADYLYYNRQ